MAWQPLAQRLGDLPLVLCGPILRRVDQSSVTVWVVTSASCRVTLTVQKHPAQSGPGPTLTGAADALRFGERLWIATVTAQAGADLPPQTLFSYDLKFLPAGGQEKSFAAALGSEDRLAALCYSDPILGSLGLPTFVTPPLNARDLRILHGSCRKPHGKGRDGLGLIDKCLRERATTITPYDNLVARPCQLYLTGDQIYADDVADALLFMIQDAVVPLVGGDEDLPGIGKAAQAAPGARGELTVRAGFTSGLKKPTVAKSHLLSLGEYLLMYVFTWSDVLWAPPDAWQAGSTDENNALTRCYARLPEVRRVLANIATYMMFDDHDVTDDWNIFRDWAISIYGGEGLRGRVRRRAYDKELQPIPQLGRRVVRNALSAYAVCQAWGNDPVRFSAGEGASLLQAIAVWSAGDPAALPAADAYLESILLPPADMPVNGGDLASPPNRFDWNFVLSYPGRDWETVFLDGRCHRRWPGAADDEPLPTPAALVPSDRLQEQFQIAGRPYLLVISPSPVFGVRLVELLQETVAKTGITMSYDKDYEAWSGNSEAMHSLLLFLAQAPVCPRAVLFLSGDVHHGFSFRLRYRRGGADPRGLVFMQCTSSPFKNKEGKAEWLREFEELAARTEGCRTWTWDNSAGGEKEFYVVSAPSPGPGLPPLLRPYRSRAAAVGVFPDQSITPSIEPTWRGRLDTLADRRTDSVAGAYERAVGEALGMVKYHATNEERIVVDRNHFGEIYFVADQNNNVIAAVQGLYVDGDVVGQPGVIVQTQHVAGLDPAYPEGTD